MATTGSRRRGRNASRRSGNGANAPLRAAAPINLGMSSRNTQQQRSLRKSGCDYIGVVEFKEGTADGTPLFEYLIEPSLMPQLSRVGSSFQKVHWNRLTFEISSHMPTTASGGYIMAFRPDPADIVPVNALEAKQWAVATPNSQKNSIWQSAKLSVVAQGGLNPAGALSQRQLFTSPSADVREYSPGRFVVITDGAINAEGSISLSIHWDCTFHVESFEPIVSEIAVSELINAIPYLFYTEGLESVPAEYPLRRDGASFREATLAELFPGIEFPEYNVIVQSDYQVFGKLADDQQANLAAWTRTFIANPSDRPGSLRICFGSVDPDSFLPAPIGSDYNIQQFPANQLWTIIGKTVPGNADTVSLPVVKSAGMKGHVRYTSKALMSNLKPSEILARRKP